MSKINQIWLNEWHEGVCAYVHTLICFSTHWALVYSAGEGLDYTGEALIREESVEVDVSEDRRPDAAGNQGQTEEEEKEKSPGTDQQTQESEVCQASSLSCMMKQLLLP